MSMWPNEDLDTIAAADELELASTRRDRRVRKPVTIWVVRVGDHLYVRSVYGRRSAWFRGVQDRHEGRIRAGGVNKDVRFVEVDAGDPLNDEIDTAFRRKYHRYPAQYVDPTVSPEARAATVELVPGKRRHPESRRGES
jgi:hypothetical protein